MCVSHVYLVLLEEGLRVRSRVSFVHRQWDHLPPVHLVAPWGVGTYICMGGGGTHMHYIHSMHTYIRVYQHYITIGDMYVYVSTYMYVCR